MVHLWRGFHHSTLVAILSAAWRAEELVILVPPSLKKFSFLKFFNPQSVCFHGEWPEPIRQTALNACQCLGREQIYLEHATLGVFTSGTLSGEHRLILYSRENIQVSLAAIRRLYQTERIKKIFSYPQPTHTFGLVLGYMHAILHGIELHFSQGAYSRKAHEKWFSVVDATTLTLGTPTHFMDLIQWLQACGQAAPASYTAIIGGARATKELWRQLRSDLKIAEPSVGYGATEASPGVTHLPPGVEPAEDGDIGYALEGVRVEVEPEKGVWFEGANVCLAILENENFRHAERIFLKDHLIERPVVGQSRAKSRFTFVGRTDLLVNRGGLKFSLEAIEGTLASRWGCKVMAVAVYDPRLGEDIGVLFQSGVVRPEDMQKTLREEFSLNLDLENILTTEIPLNANGKFDRKEALKFLLKTRVWSFPVVVEHLKVFLPHRGPAIWVDSLIETKKHFGAGQVHLQENAAYFTNGRVRESACIEWMAQIYGYTVAMNDILGVTPAEPANRVFIVEVKNAEFHFSEDVLRPGDRIRIEVLCTHDFGTLKVVNGKVFHGEKLLAQCGLKLYCGV